MIAIKEGNTQITKELIDEGVDVNTVNDKGNAVLILASQNGHTDIAKALIKVGADGYSLHRAVQDKKNL